MVKAKVCIILDPRKNVSLKKEIGQYDDRQCHLVCNFNFRSTERTSFTPDPVIIPPTTHWYIHTQLLYTHSTADNFFLDAHERWHFSLWYSPISFFNRIFYLYVEHAFQGLYERISAISSSLENDLPTFCTIPLKREINLLLLVYGL